MLQKIRNMKKSRRGFTLVEIIVVLVILAILAAFTIPAMLGFVNDANNKAYIAQARECYVAYQSAATESQTKSDGKTDVATTLATRANELINSDTDLVVSEVYVDASGNVTHMKCLKTGKVTMEYKDGAWTTTKAS